MKWLIIGIIVSVALFFVFNGQALGTLSVVDTPQTCEEGTSPILIVAIIMAIGLIIWNINKSKRKK